MGKSPPARGPKREFDRHVSGTGTRGLPKKGGHGKGGWGADGDPLDHKAVKVLDKGDPNHDSDEEGPPVDSAPRPAASANGGQSAGSSPKDSK